MPEPRRRDPVDVIPLSAVDDELIEQRHGFHGQPAQEGAVNRRLHRRIALFAIPGVELSHDAAYQAVYEITSKLLES